MEIKNLPISNRLKMNATLAQESRVLADVGCDHAYCSIYLAGNRMVERCIAMDVNAGPLARAQENIRLYGLEECIETRLSNGLEKLVPGEADTILVSGMGGPLMQEILERGAACVRAAKQLVLQPQSEIAEFRSYLHKQGLQLLDEDMCCEDGKYYPVLRVAVPQETMRGAKEGVPETVEPRMAADSFVVDGVSQELAYAYGPCLIRKKHPVLLEFLTREYGKKQELLQRLGEQKTERSAVRMAQVQTELTELKGLLEVMGQA